MRRQQGQYPEADINSVVAAQLQHYQVQRLQQQQNTVNSLPGRVPSQAADKHQYVASKIGHLQWDQDSVNQLPSYAFNEGQGNEGSRLFFDGQRSNYKVDPEKQANKDLRGQPYPDKIDGGFEKSALPQTFEGLEQKFHDNIVRLSKDQEDAEDAENARHRETLNEINANYQEKLLALRARQALHREECLHNESQTRHQQYQQTNLNSYANNALPGEPHGLTRVTSAAATAAAAAVAAGAYEEGHRAYAAGHYQSLGERPENSGISQGRGLEPRGQYPGGRAYNAGGRRF